MEAAEEHTMPVPKELEAEVCRHQLLSIMGGDRSQDFRFLALWPDVQVAKEPQSNKRSSEQETSPQPLAMKPASTNGGQGYLCRRPSVPSSGEWPFTGKQNTPCKLMAVLLIGKR